MSLRLHALNLWLRLTVRPALARMKSPLEVRDRLERDAARFFRTPRDAHFVNDQIRRAGRAHDAGMIDGVWASCGRPDRRKVILYLHGGAYLAGSPRTHQHLGAALAGAAGVRALLPDYRLAPEHPFPAALEDAMAAYRHLLGAGYEAGNIALAGDSAGGGLAFALLLEIAAQEMPPPAAVVGFSPWADLTGTAESLRRNAARDVMLPARRLDEVAGYYMGHADRSDPRASPRFGDWRRPPPALIMAGRSEILLDDSRNLAEALRIGGGSVQLELWRGLPHAWPIFVGLLPEADQAVAGAGAFLARYLNGDLDPDATL